MFPESPSPVPHPTQLSSGACVALLVAFKLRSPIVGVAARDAAVPRADVEEATISEDRNAKGRNQNVRSTRQARSVSVDAPFFWKHSARHEVKPILDLRTGRSDA